MMMLNAQASLFPAATEVVASEWWAHCRAGDGGHQLHYDLVLAPFHQMTVDD